MCIRDRAEVAEEVTGCFLQKVMRVRNGQSPGPIAMSHGRPRVSRLADRSDSGLDLGAQIGRDGGATRSLSGDLLALFAHDVAEVCLDELGVRSVCVLLATDEVADENDRVDTVCGAGAVELDRDVVLSAVALELRSCLLYTSRCV